MSTVEDRIREHGQITVIPPELQEPLEFRTYAVRHMLQTGLGARIRDFKEDSETAEVDSAQILVDQRNVLIACSVYPKLVRVETKSPGYLCIDDIPDDDVAYCFDQIVTVDDSRFFGTNRTAFNPDKYGWIIDGQQEVCHQIDGICARYGVNPLDVERWSGKEFSRVLEVFEGARIWREAHPVEQVEE